MNILKRENRIYELHGYIVYKDETENVDMSTVGKSSDCDARNKDGEMLWRSPAYYPKPFIAKGSGVGYLYLSDISELDGKYMKYKDNFKGCPIDEILEDITDRVFSVENFFPLKSDIDRIRNMREGEIIKVSGYEVWE
jgi:hypothetical protein